MKTYLMIFLKEGKKLNFIIKFIRLASIFIASFKVNFAGTEQLLESLNKLPFIVDFILYKADQYYNTPYDSKLFVLCMSDIMLEKCG